jgi:hypothetical protein
MEPLYPVPTAQSFAMPDDESNIQFDDTGVIVKAASFHKLLEKLTSESGMKSSLLAG